MTLPSGRSPRVLYCTDTYPPQVNGVSVVTALSVRGLLARGWRCAVIAPSYGAQAIDSTSNPGAEIVTSIPSMPMPVYPEVRCSLPDFRTVRAAIDVFQPDLVHCATEFVLGALGQRAARRAGIPVVSSYHTDFGRYAAAYGVPSLRGAINRYVGTFHRKNVLTFTPSAPARDDLLRMGVKSATVWGRGVDIDTFSPRRRDPVVRATFGDDCPFIFLHVGRLAAEKNVHRIIEAFRLATKMLPPGSIGCIIAGSGPEEQRLRGLAPPGLNFLGVLDRETMLPGLYASADAFLFASLTETLGLVVLEAMSSGLPVIATPAGGVADHLRHLDNGLAVPQDDPVAMARAMVELATNPDLRRQLSAGARRTAESLSWEAELDRLDDCYRTIIGAKATDAESAELRAAS